MPTDELYNKMNWEIPKSNNFVSDSESPLSLLSSPTPTMPSPTLAPVMVPMPSYNSSSQEENHDRKLIPSTTSTNTYGEAANNTNIKRTTMYQEHIIACNNSISCIRPQSISIKWLTTSTTTTGNNDNKRQAGESSNLEEEYQSTSSDEEESSCSTITTTTTTAEEDTTTSTTESNGHSTIKIIFSNKNNKTAAQEKEGNASSMTNHQHEYHDDKDSNSTTNSYLADHEEEDPNLNNESDYSTTSSPLNKKKRNYNKQNAPTTNKKKRKEFIVKKVVNPITPAPTTTPLTTKNKQKRTVTSYDLQTSEYLKSVFFEVYSKQEKLTKEQRAKVQLKTGLPSRNITYWFSNHKRRFQDTLKVYRKIVEESQGSVQNYEDFLQWRKDHELPENVTEDEVAKCKEEA